MTPDYKSEAKAAAEDAAAAFAPPEKPHPIDWQNKMDRLARLAREVRSFNTAPGYPPIEEKLTEIIEIAEEAKRVLVPPPAEEIADAIWKDVAAGGERK